MVKLSLRSWAGGRQNSLSMSPFVDAFKKNRSGFMGVDIGMRRLHLLEFSGSEQPCVSGFGSASIADHAVIDDRVADIDAVGDSVKQALHRSGIGSRRAALAVAGPAVISKMVELPAGLGDAEIEEQIHYDAAAYISHPIEELHLDFRIVESDPSNPDINRVMLAACRRDTVASYIDALAKGGISVAIVDLASAALENACGLLVGDIPAAQVLTNRAVFDVRAEYTRLTVQHRGKSVYSRELTLATQQLTDLLVAQHDVLNEDDLFGQLRAGAISASMIADKVADFAADAARQIEQALQFFTSAAAFDETIDEVVIVGDIGLLPGSERALGEHLNRPFRLGNPIANMSASSAAKDKNVEWYGPALSVASGLAIRAVR